MAKLIKGADLAQLRLEGYYVTDYETIAATDNSLRRGWCYINILRDEHLERAMKMSLVTCKETAEQHWVENKGLVLLQYIYGDFTLQETITGTGPYTVGSKHVR